MDAVQRAVIVPTVEIVVDRAARRQVLRQRRPLTARAEDIHDPVDDLAHIDLAVSPAVLGGWDEWFDEPLLWYSTCYAGGTLTSVAHSASVRSLG